MLSFFFKGIKEGRRRWGREEERGGGIERTAGVLDTLFQLWAQVCLLPSYPRPAPVLQSSSMHWFCTSAPSGRRAGRSSWKGGKSCGLALPVPVTFLSTARFLLHLVQSYLLPYLLTSEDWLISQGLSLYYSLSGYPTRQGAMDRPRNLPRTLVD